MSRYTGLGWFVAMGLLALLLAPVVVLVGDPVLERRRRKRYRAAVQRLGLTHGSGTPLAAAYQLNLAFWRFDTHPFVIALTAPGRWARPKLRSLRRRLWRPVRWLLRSRAARRRGWDGGWWDEGHEGLFPDDPGLSGVREPRRPHPMPPTDAVALREPTEY
jgi:hypothetical protein